MLMSKDCEDLALPSTACGTLKNCPHASLAAAFLEAGPDPCLDSTTKLIMVVGVQLSQPHSKNFGELAP